MPYSGNSGLFFTKNFNSFRDIFLTKPTAIDLNKIDWKYQKTNKTNQKNQKKKIDMISYIIIEEVSEMIMRCNNAFPFNNKSWRCFYDVTCFERPNDSAISFINKIHAMIIATLSIKKKIQLQ